MEHWTIVLIFISINSLRIFQGTQASQSPGYIGCYPISSANLVDKAIIGLNNGIFCVVVCASYGYRYAATKGHNCKCANKTRFYVYEDNAECDFPCPGRLTEHCGGAKAVSLHDTWLPEMINYPECVKDQHSFVALRGDITRTKITVLFDNSATLCTSLCKASQYIFSGTKKELCMCGDRIEHGIDVSAKCELKCPGNGEETCGGEDSVSLRHTGYVKPRTETQGPIEPETSSNSDLTTSSQPIGDDFTHKYTEKQLSVFPFIGSNTTVSTKHDTKASVANWIQMTAVYIWLPVGIIVAGSVVLVVRLILRYKRQKSEASFKRRKVSSVDDHCQTLDPEISQYVERSTQTITTAGDNCAVGYLTPINSTGTARYEKPIDTNAIAGYITPIDSNAIAGYITPTDTDDTQENYNYYVEIDA